MDQELTSHALGGLAGTRQTLLQPMCIRVWRADVKLHE